MIVVESGGGDGGRGKERTGDSGRGQEAEGVPIGPGQEQEAAASNVATGAAVVAGKRVAQARDGGVLYRERQLYGHRGEEEVQEAWWVLDHHKTPQKFLALGLVILQMSMTFIFNIFSLVASCID